MTETRTALRRIFVVAGLAMASCATAPEPQAKARKPQPSADKAKVVPHDAKALVDVAARVSQEKDGKGAVVVFDLDHTLFDNRTRTLQLLLQFASTLPPEKLDAATKIRALSLPQVHYRLADTLAEVKLKDPAVLEAAKRYWAERFFADEAVALDVPYTGAVEYVRELHKRGAFVVYLTGRATEQMLVGSTESLRRWGFPIGVPGTQLIHKPVVDMEDVTFKEQAFVQIDRLGTVVAAFENEPVNLLAMAKHWSDAIPVFLQTDFNPRNPSELPKNARKLRDFSPPR